MTESQGNWSTVEIAGKTADIFEPAEPSDHGYTIVHLHGHGRRTLTSNTVWSAELDKHGLRAVCPHGQRSWWGRVICEEFDAEMSPADFVLEHVLQYIAQQWSAEPPRIAICGVSMGGQGAIRLAHWYPEEFPVMAAVSPAVDFHNWFGLGLPLDEMYRDSAQAWQDTATLHVNQNQSPAHQLIVCDPADVDCFEGTERLIGKFIASGIRHERDLTTTGGGHSWEYFDRMAPKIVKFLAERLEYERMKLPVV